MENEQNVNVSPKEYIVKSVENAQRVCTSYSKNSLLQRVLMAINWGLLQVTLLYSFFPNWVPLFLGGLCLFGSVSDAYQNAIKYRAWAAHDRLKTRLDLSNIKENGGSIEDARDYIVVKQEKFEKEENWATIRSVILFLFSVTTASITGFAINGKILPAAYASINGPILATIMGEFALTEMLQKNAYAQRIDDLQTTLDLDEVKRTRKLGGKNEK